jgi:hypothetical protein
VPPIVLVPFGILYWLLPRASPAARGRRRLRASPTCTPSAAGALFVWLISHQPAVLFSQTKPAITNQPAVLFSQNKPVPAISHQPNEEAAGLELRFGAVDCSALSFLIERIRFRRCTELRGGDFFPPFVWRRLIPSHYIFSLHVGMVAANLAFFQFTAEWLQRTTVKGN